jgi:hypothetical protein
MTLSASAIAKMRRSPKIVPEGRKSGWKTQSDLNRQLLSLPPLLQQGSQSQQRQVARKDKLADETLTRKS